MIDTDKPAQCSPLGSALLIEVPINKEKAEEAIATLRNYQEPRTFFNHSWMQFFVVIENINFKLY